MASVIWWDEELVVGEALAGRRGGGEIGRALGRVGGDERRRASRASARWRFRLGSIHSGKSGARASASWTARVMVRSVRPWVSG